MYRGYVAFLPKGAGKSRYVVYVQIVHRRVGGYQAVDRSIVCLSRSLEAVEAAFLLFLLAVVEGRHARLKMRTLSFDAQTCVALFLNGLK